MIPIIRSLVSFAAGIARMPLGRFTLFTFLGSLPWTAALVFAGVALGANWETIGAWLKRFEYADRSPCWWSSWSAGSGSGSSSRGEPLAPGRDRAQRLTRQPLPAGYERRSSGGRTFRKSRYTSRSYTIFRPPAR